MLSQLDSLLIKQSPGSPSRKGYGYDLGFAIACPGHCELPKEVTWDPLSAWVMDMT